MEQTVEQQLLLGIQTLVDLKDPFIKEWEQLLAAPHPKLLDQFNSIIRHAFQQLSIKELPPSADSLILSLIAEWQQRFAEQHSEDEAISFIMKIETIFHQLLSQNSSHSFLKHQAIQALFSRILDHSLLVHASEHRTEKWLKMILDTHIVPMNWIAVIKKEQDHFFIEKLVCHPEVPIADHLVDMCNSLQAGQLEHLSSAVTRLLNSGDSAASAVAIPCINDIVMISPRQPDTRLTEQQIEFIQKMYYRQLKLQHLENNVAWKDASLLFLQRLLTANSGATAIEAITEGLVTYMPFRRCALFLYSSAENKVFGAAGKNIDLPAVQQIKESIPELSLLKKYFGTLRESQPLYFANASDVLPEKYIRAHHLHSLVILPLYVPRENKFLGVALLDQGRDTPFQISAQTMAGLIKFGQYAGELLHSFWAEALQVFGTSKGLLTDREKEVLKLISEGASIAEAAQSLHLSSYTVRDYVSAIIQKLAAKNRTDAAVKAIKMKLIS